MPAQTFSFSSSNSPSQMRRCQHCGHLNRRSLLACEQCEKSLTGSEWVTEDRSDLSNLRELALNRHDDISRREAVDKPAPKPKIKKPGQTSTPAIFVDATGKQIKLSEINLSETHRVHMSADLRDEVKQGTRIGTAVFDEDMKLCLTIGDGESPPLLMRMAQRTPIKVGREDPNATQRPDVDLVPYGGYQMGISRQHAEVELVGKRAFIRDLGSSNGTFLNGVQVDPHETHQLRDGDVVLLGRMRLEVTYRR